MALSRSHSKRQILLDGEWIKMHYCYSVPKIEVLKYHEIECANDYLICETKRITEIKYIRNQGVHPTYGFGYKWSPVTTKIYPGDTIIWQWSLGSASEDKGINVFQTANFGKN